MLDMRKTCRAITFAIGLIGAGVDSGLAVAQGLSVSIGRGVAVEGNSSAFVFPANFAEVTGGSGNYSYSWVVSPSDNFGTWNPGGTSQSFAPSVFNILGGCTTTEAKVDVVVHDNSSGITATSNSVPYIATNNTSASGPPVYTGAPPSHIGCQ